MQRDRFNRDGDEKSSRKRRKRKPGLQKQKRLKRAGEKQRFDLAATLGIPKLVQGQKRQSQSTGSTRRRASGKTMIQSVRDRKRRSQLRPITNTTLSVREIASSARVISFALLLLCVYALWQIGNNPRFYLSRIDIDGARILQRGDIVRNSGVFGTHVFAIQPNTAAEQIGAMPGVRSAQVDLIWPDRLHITIEEEEPVLNWRENGRDYWVNATGTLIPAFGQDMSLLTIIAEVPEVPPPVLSEVVFDSEGALTQVSYDELGKPIGSYFDEEGGTVEIEPRKVTYLDFVPEAVIETAQKLKADVPTIEFFVYSPADGLQYQDARGWVAKFGAGGDLTAKMAIYEAVVANTQARGIVPSYISVAHPEKPVFKPLSGYTPPVREN